MVILKKKLNTENTKKKFNVRETIKKNSKNITEGSLNVYVRSAKRLLTLANLNEFPVTPGWLLKKELLQKFDNLSLEKRRSLGVVAVKLSDAYSLDRKKTFPWVQRMNKTSDEYNEKRSKREWSEREKKKKPEKGWNDVVRLSKFLMKTNKRFFNKPLDQIKRKDLYNMQRAIIWYLFKSLPLRLTYANIHVKQPDSTKHNFIFKTKKGRGVWKIVLNDHKTFKFRGKIEHNLQKSLSRYLNKFIPASKKLNNHDFLLANRNGSRMTKSGLSKYLTRESAKFFGNNGFSAGMIRILFATHNRHALEKQKNVSEKLGHKNAETTLGYSRKN